MNAELFARFGQVKATTPLTRSPHIRQANALRIDWNDVLPAAECTYILGNPPFVGHQWRTVEQQTDHDAVWAGVHGQAGRLDFVSCWYLLASRYMVPATVGAFVSTNSVTQGEQARILAACLWGTKLHIRFAHRTFAWKSDARGAAHVHVVIIGFANSASGGGGRRSIFEENADDGEIATPVNRINAYLIDAPDVVLESRGNPLSGVPEMVKGSQPTDGGHLIFDDAERAELVRLEPAAERYLRRYIGGDEFLNGGFRWCLWLKEAEPGDLRRMPHVMTRVKAVRESRMRSPTLSVREAANSPTLFTQDRQPNTPFLAIPEVSSERRQYIPIAFMQPSIVPSNKIQVVQGATLYHFAVLSSVMHMAWVRTVTGRLESRLSYSPAVYNNYPWPTDVTDAKRERVESAAQGVLDARGQFPDATLADLYDPNAMPPALRRAHDALDRAVDRCYRQQPFTSERQRLEFLFNLYEQLIAPLTPRPPQRRPRRPRPG